ncbi:hypothetical protein RH915_07820 [Serpentinicella sp. ANB-PHB4]|uniref:hypothetical protein n=1 Tax=Serpentinicella sp. ANB-PHB4 TaxID=3074076 RepID=UPI00285559E5|nr:hypothetical protein [Serpentinicella sp. ANB-PHB4]MDR5659395.1 hypothetical protein [Serpentinicella sp. ANB-PHB4]
MKKINKYLILFLCLSLIGVLTIIYTNIKFYEGIIVMSPWITLLLLIPIVYTSKLKRESVSQKKIKAMLSLYIIIPVLLFLWTPQYTYNEAKLLVTEEYNTSTIVEKDINTVPVTGSFFSQLRTTRAYYFTIESEEQLKYVMVTAENGNIFETEQYWSK